MSTRNEQVGDSRLSRFWTTRIGLGPAFLFFATLNWVNVIVVPHAGDALRDQHLVTGFLWFAAGIVSLPWAGVILMKSIDRRR